LDVKGIESAFDRVASETSPWFGGDTPTTPGPNMFDSATSSARKPGCVW